MNNFFLSLVITALLAGIFQLFLPWWTIAIAGFAVAYFMKQNSLPAFFAGFAAVFILWVVYAYLLSAANDHLLVKKVAELMKALTKQNTAALYIITGTVGGLLSGVAAVSGSQAAKLFAR